MTRAIIAFFTSVLIFLPLTAQAQDEQPQAAYVYATYFVCDPTEESRADEIVLRNYKPHYDAAVEAGDIAAWSWLAHFVGGKWRRIHVLTATNMDDLLDASGALGEILEETTPEAGRVFTEVCPTHEDYIWQTVATVPGTPQGTERGGAGFSTYFVCDMNDQEKADELVAETLGPIYDRYIADGQLTSWLWLQHVVGGKYRRLLATSAPDHKTMMRARAGIIEELTNGRAERAFRQFSEICPSHQDYMWDIQIENP